MSADITDQNSKLKRHKNGKVRRVAPGSLLPLENVSKRARLQPSSEEQQRLIDLFSSRWYLVKDLQRIEAESGVSYKRGKFSNAEAATINEAVQQYIAENNMGFSEFRQEFFGRRGHGRLHDFFIRAAQQLPGRPVIHVYHYLRRQYHPGNWQGAWKPEEDEQLRRLFAMHGPRWEIIGEQLGRFHVSCKDRYRIIRQSFNTGRWSEDEVERLRGAIREWRQERPEDAAVWAWIAERVGTRSWMQCLTKYTGSLELSIRREHANGVGAKKQWLWTDEEDLILIHKIYDLAVEDESEIIWPQLLDSHWNYWSPYCLVRRWKLLRRRVFRERYLDMDTILETLLTIIRPLSPDRVPKEDAELVVDSPN